MLPDEFRVQGQQWMNYASFVFFLNSLLVFLYFGGSFCRQEMKVSL